MKTSIRKDTKLWVFEQEAGERIYVFGYTWFEARGGALAALQTPSATVTGHEIGNVKDHLVEAGSTIVYVDRGASWFEIIETLRRMSGEEARKLLASPSPFESDSEKQTICKNQFTDHLDGGRFYVCELPAGHGGEQHACGDVGWPVEPESEPEVMLEVLPSSAPAHPSSAELRERLIADAEHNADWPEMARIASQAIDALEAMENGRQDESDGSGGVHSVQRQDGLHHLRRSGEQRGTKAEPDDVGAAGSGHSESSGLLAGSGESDEGDERRTIGSREWEPLHARIMELVEENKELCKKLSNMKRVLLDTPLCAGCAAVWFTERNTLGQPDEPCIACSFSLTASATIDRLTTQKDAAYDERNRLVALFASMALALGWKAGVGQHEDEPGKEWDADWRTLVMVETPEGQASWHFHDSHNHLVKHLPSYVAKWDGHDTPTKYARLERLMRGTKVNLLAVENEALRERLKMSLDREETLAKDMNERIPDLEAMVQELKVKQEAVAAEERDECAKVATATAQEYLDESTEAALYKDFVRAERAGRAASCARRVEYRIRARSKIETGQDMTRNPTTEEELARVRSELNHYREKYLNDDRIPIANAEIIRLGREIIRLSTELEKAQEFEQRTRHQLSEFTAACHRADAAEFALADARTTMSRAQPVVDAACAWWNGVADSDVNLHRAEI